MYICFSFINKPSLLVSSEKTNVIIIKRHCEDGFFRCFFVVSIWLTPISITKQVQKKSPIFPRVPSLCGIRLENKHDIYLSDLTGFKEYNWNNYSYLVSCWIIFTLLDYQKMWKCNLTYAQAYSGGVGAKRVLSMLSVSLCYI